MYSPGFDTWIDVPGLSGILCGNFRPGHFRGVLTIVARLFAWCRCDLAAFGAKDAQQLWLVRRMVRDLELPVEVVEGPVVREADGLALSSRNVFLAPEERAAAGVLNRALALAVERLEAGAPPAAALAAALEPVLAEPRLELEYLHVADWATLESLAGWERGARSAAAAEPGPGERVALLACRAGRTRLIDNRRAAAPR